MTPRSLRLKANGTHFTEPQALAAFEKPLFPLTRLAPAAQIWNKVSAIGLKAAGPGALPTKKIPYYQNVQTKVD